MSSEIEKLTNSLRNAFDGDPWYGQPLLKALQAIDYKIANSRPAGFARSPAIILRHMLSWRYFVIVKIKGKAEFDIDLNSEMDWSNVSLNSEADWQAMLAEWRETQLQLLDLLSMVPDDFLDQPVPGRSYNYQYLIEGIIQHDIYHQGQIALLTSAFKAHQ